MDVEFLKIGGASALRTVHRMSYEPGNEMIMGHFLVPLRRGLFEARVVSIDQLTGYRESALFLLKRMGRLPPNDEEELKRLVAVLRQADFDDPQHDDSFPNHALSRTRAAMRWLYTESGLHVTEMPAPYGSGKVELPRLGCALVPPPRFVYDSAIDASQKESCESFCRVSFCGTDGVERLLVNRWSLPAQGLASDLPRVAESFARELHEASGVEDMRLTVEALPSIGVAAQRDALLARRARTAMVSQPRWARGSAARCARCGAGRRRTFLSVHRATLRAAEAMVEALVSASYTRVIGRWLSINPCPDAS